MTEYSSNQPVKKEWTEKSEDEKKRQEKGTQTAKSERPQPNCARASSTELDRPALELDTKYV